MIFPFVCSATYTKPQNDRPIRGVPGAVLALIAETHEHWLGSVAQSAIMGFRDKPRDDRRRQFGRSIVLFSGVI
jgi:hypothetical protein